jgi:fructoselysine-6-P-deglycase FrlB-like protein
MRAPSKERGALTIGIANNQSAPLLQEVDRPIFLDTGAEPIAGSTRMKAGTAQRVALNLLSMTVCMDSSSESWGASAASTSMALTCQWRSRPQHQSRQLGHQLEAASYAMLAACLGRNLCLRESSP